jgi:uncharacterized cupin superfamily protein
VSKSVSDIVTIGPDVGTKNVLEISADSASASWNEVEWRNFGSEAEGRFYGGVWFGEPGIAVLDKLGFDEFCYIRKGVVRFIDAMGENRRFFAGDGFFIPRGFQGEWEVIESTEMAYVALGPF